MSQLKVPQTALERMQQITTRLISNTPQLGKMLDDDSALKPKNSSMNKKNSLIKNESNKSSIPVFSSLNKSDIISSNDCYDRCKELVNQLQISHDKIYTLEEEIVMIKQRFVEREIQYRKIIQQLQDQIKSKSSLGGSDRNRMQNILDLHKEILDNIGMIQNKTSKILIEQESDIRRFFHKKINEIKEKFKQDKVNKTEKDLQYLEKEKQMVSELEWIKNIAHKIDLQNQTLLKKYTTLKSQYQIQQKDKQILMKQLVMKKKQNSVLKSQVQQYEKLLNEVSKEMEENQIKGNGQVDNGNYQSGNKGERGSSKINGGRSLTKKQMNGSNSRVSVGDSGNKNQNQKWENTVNHLNKVINKQKKKVRDLKNLYMKQVGSKSQLQKIVRKLVDDIRDSIVEVERDRTKKKKTDDQLSQQARQKLLQQLLSNQKILTLIYDRAFYSGVQSTNLDKIPEDLERILENQEEEGFV